MLSKKSYPAEYVGQCRNRIEADTRAFDKVANGARKADARAAAAVLDLEHAFFNNLVIALEGSSSSECGVKRARMVIRSTRCVSLQIRS